MSIVRPSMGRTFCYIILTKWRAKTKYKKKGWISHNREIQPATIDELFWKKHYASIC